MLRLHDISSIQTLLRQPVFKLRVIILISFIFALSIQAQDEVILPDIGDVPLAAKIQVTQDETDPTTAIVTGEEGAVFPNAVVSWYRIATRLTAKSPPQL